MISVEVEASAPEPSRFPRRFGDRYVLLKRLGHGGMGEVFLGLTGQSGVERICALKIVKRFQDRDADEMTQRFLDEAKVVTKLSHENLVYVFDFGVVDRQGYLGMEYVAGKTLTEVWNRCAQRRVGFPTGVALFLAGEVTAALGYAHAVDGLGLVHRDISPSNIMLAYTGGVKVIDFGLAKWRSKVAQTAAGINWGKVSYMSPEQHLGRPVDRRSDLYSAGVILWELLTGRQLFPSPEARLANVEIIPPSRVNAHVTPALDRLVLKALATEPDDRFQTGEEMSRALLAEMPRDAGKLQIAEFLKQIFDTDAEREATEQRQLVARAAAVAERAVAQVGESFSIETDPLIGAVLADRYFVRRRVGQGAMGSVYEGHHTGVGKRVAIKVPRRAERRQAELLQRFRLEANAASQIGHPNIADVTDCGTTPAGDFFFVMEFIDGIDLERLIDREGKLQVERALLIALQICRALEAAHAAGIIHRDLKPSNVMLVRSRDEADFVKVLDFGVAKFLRDGAAPTDRNAIAAADQAVGTPRYMAPEQIAPGSAVDFRADIYGVGGILYALLSGGGAPVEGDSVQEVCRRKVNDDASPIARHRSDLSPSLEKLLMACLARDPAARPENATALKKALLAALEEARGAVSAMAVMRSPSETAVVAARPGGRRIALAAGATGVAAGVVAIVALLARRPEAPAVTAQPPPAPRAAQAVAPAPIVTSALEPEPAAAPQPTAAPQPAAAPPPEPQRPPAEPREPRALATPKPAPPARPAAPPSPSPEALLAEAESFVDKGMHPSAVIAARRALKLGAGARAHLIIGRAHARMEDWEKAAEAYDKVLELQPANAEARVGRDRAKSELER